MRIRSERAAAALRWQNVKCMPASTGCATATAWRAGSNPMMCRTSTTSSNSPVVRTALSSGEVSPTKVARTLASAGCGLSNEMFRSRINTAKAGSPSIALTRCPSASVMVCCLAMGKQPWVTRETMFTWASNATPLKPPTKTPEALPCPAKLPSDETANCTTSLRLDTKPPNT